MSQDMARCFASHERLDWSRCLGQALEDLDGEVEAQSHGNEYSHAVNTGCWSIGPFGVFRCQETLPGRTGFESSDPSLAVREDDVDGVAEGDPELFNDGASSEPVHEHSLVAATDQAISVRTKSPSILDQDLDTNEDLECTYDNGPLIEEQASEPEVSNPALTGYRPSFSNPTETIPGTTESVANQNFEEHFPFPIDQSSSAEIRTLFSHYSSHLSNLLSPVPLKDASTQAQSGLNQALLCFGRLNIFGEAGVDACAALYSLLAMSAAHMNAVFTGLRTRDEAASYLTPGQERRLWHEAALRYSRLSQASLSGTLHGSLRFSEAGYTNVLVTLLNMGVTTASYPLSNSDM